MTQSKIYWLTFGFLPIPSLILSLSWTWYYILVHKQNEKIAQDYSAEKEAFPGALLPFVSS